jgi:hypothetical protein
VAKPRIDALSSFAGVATFVAGFALADLGQFEYYNHTHNNQFRLLARAVETTVLP